MKKIATFIHCFYLWLQFAVFAGGEGETDVTTVTFGDVSWDSVQVHNRIMALHYRERPLKDMLQNSFPGDTLPILNGLSQGDVDVDMESWHSNFMDVYEKAIASGKYHRSRTEYAGCTSGLVGPPVTWLKDLMRKLLTLRRSAIFPDTHICSRIPKIRTRESSTGEWPDGLR